MTRPLSPAAQAVLDAVVANTEPDCDTHHLIAAALRALADQVVPEEGDPPPLPPIHEMIENPIDSLAHESALMQRQETRRKILAIAAELEGHGDG